MSVIVFVKQLNYWNMELGILGDTAEDKVLSDQTAYKRNKNTCIQNDLFSLDHFFIFSIDIFQTWFH